jgi:citrate synthase
MWLPAAEALRRLNVKPQTLYANVSRGRIRAKADPAEPRRSLYHSDDVDRLVRRTTGRPRAEVVAVEAINWGEPVLRSAMSTVANGRLYYRGQDAVELAGHASLEDIANLLWAGFSPLRTTTSGAGQNPGAGGVLVALAHRAAADPPSLLRNPDALRADASAVLATVADAIAGPGRGPLHDRLAGHFQRPDAADDLRAALVLLADHELNASTFAARVTVSTGASLAAGALAGLAALSGPLHGRASHAITALADDLESSGADPTDALREWLGEGRAVPGFGHRLYPHGDVRAAALLARLPLPPAYAGLLAAAEIVLDERPNVDFALAALAAAHNLPETAPMEIFALARSVGWLAHMLEQVQSGALIRPRARYIGPKPAVT